MIRGSPARAVQLCVDMASHIISNSESPPPTSMAEAFNQLVQLNLIDNDLSAKMISAVGFRNLAVHSYEKIDWDIVASICEHHLQDFKKFAIAIEDAVTE